jgi:hypothetical protein
MKRIAENLGIILIGLLIAICIIKCQENQRKCNIEPEALKAGQYNQVYYDYQKYMNNRSFKNN